MTADAIRKALHSNQPFKIRTVDGKVLEVPHQDYAALSKSGRTIVVMTPDDTWEIIDVFLICALEKADAGTAA